MKLRRPSLSSLNPKKKKKDDVLTTDVTMREGLNKTRYLGFLLGTPHLDTEYFPHTKMCSKKKVDYTMQKQITICFVMGSVKSFKEDVKYTE